MRNIQKMAGVACGAAALLAFGAGPALAATGSVHANLRAIEGNGVDGSGTAMVKVDGTTLTVTMAAMGLLADQPHAAHIHYGEQARHECPGLADDTNMDGWLNTTEGVPAYGPVQVSLTTSGDTTCAASSGSPNTGSSHADSGKAWTSRKPAATEPTATRLPPDFSSSGRACWAR